MLNRLWIRSAVALVEAGSFTRAAVALNLTQAAISQHASQLEARLGAIVIRRSRWLEWTPAGLALLDYARELEAADKRLTARLADTDKMHGSLDLVTPGSVGLLLYALLLDLQ